MLFNAALVALAATAVSAVKPLKVAGTDFYDPDSGEKFQIVGMAYQPGGSSAYLTGKGDPLSDADKCTRDAALMQMMGINTIRSYNLNPDLNHDACASIFNAAGIYMILDVNAPGDAGAISNDQPWTTYYAEYLNRTFAILEGFSGYPNTLAFFSGNEVISKESEAAEVPPYLRAVTRDMHNYSKKHLKRQIPIGYSAADVRDVLDDTFAYLQCAEDGKEDDPSRAEIFALNSYSWCGPKATYKSSGYVNLTESFKDSSIPAFFSEYGCNDDPPRLWKETHAIYGSDMTPVFSGAIAYEWTQEENDFGFVKLKGDELTLMDDYNRLTKEFSTLDWKKIQSVKAEKKKITPPKCSTKLIKGSKFDSNFTLPVPPPGTQKMIDNGIDHKPKSKLIDLKDDDYNVKLTVKGTDGKEITGLKVVPLESDEYNWYGKNKFVNKATNGDSTGEPGKSDDSNKESKDDEENAGASMRPMVLAAVVPALALLML